VEPGSGAGQKKTVMICDDEDDLLSVYSNYLKRKFNIVTASSGDACITLYKEETAKGRKIDVLLLDYRLGDMLGDKVACQIRDLDGTKTLLISAYEIDERTLKVLIDKRCIASRLKKPVSLALLTEKIDELIS
jgi:response regulator RpfG family c-di-GMP phosphodiesterase